MEDVRMGWWNPGVVTFVGAFLVAAGSLWGFIRQNSRAEEVARLNRELATKSDQLAQKSDEIARLTKDNLATVTGGDSYCYVDIGFLGYLPNQVDRWLHKKGSFPLYDVAMQITDLNKLKDIGQTPIEDRKQKVLAAKTNLNVGNFGGGELARDLGRLKFPDGEVRAAFLVDFSARNGGWSQKIGLRRGADGKWLLASRVTKGDVILDESISPNYPRKENGEPDW
jgi:hypothetical protein